MTVEKIYFEELFPTGMYANQRLGIEISISPEDSILQAYKYAKAEVNESFKAINPEAIVKEAATGRLVSVDDALDGVIPVQQVVKFDIQAEVENTIAEIEKCTEIDGYGGLLSFRLPAAQNAAVKAAYDLKMIQLTNKK